ncbi:hypothetical protein CDIK_1379 [Cucumispora dikerogammari]|nr:hypothetical protein CDIK_1379 [Cucumispora dikerogammari]
MFGLVINLSIITCDKKANKEERLDAKVKNYEDKNGDLADLPFKSNFCTYKLNFYHEETECILYVDLKIKKKKYTHIKLISGQLVKCTENIGVNNFVDGYEIKFDFREPKYEFLYIDEPKHEKNFFVYETIKYTESWRHCRENYKKHYPYRYCQGCIYEGNKTKAMSHFRKELGIKGDTIRTTMFKFIFHYEIINLTINGEYMRMIVETMPFRFNENVKGILVLEKEVKSQCCERHHTHNI